MVQHVFFFVRYRQNCAVVNCLLHALVHFSFLHVDTAVAASSPAPPAAESVLVAKYSYAANKNGPIGEELNLKKDDQLR